MNYAPPEVAKAILPTAAADDCVFVDPQTGAVTVYPENCTPDNP